MPTLKLTDEQVVDLINQLSSEGEQSVLKALNAERDACWEKTLIQGEEQLRRLCVEGGLNWDSMNEEEREAFIDDLLHEGDCDY